MAVGTYAALVADVQNYLHRTDIAAEIDSWIGYAEAKFNRMLRVRQQDITTQLTATSNTVALPADYLQLRNLEISASPVIPLRFVTPEQKDLYDLQTSTGQPRLYTIEGTNLILAPSPDQTYTLNCEYFAKLAGLSGTNTTNWLLTNWPDAYVYGVLLESMPFIGDDQRVTTWSSAWQAVIGDINRADDDSNYAGSVIRMRADVCW